MASYEWLLATPVSKDFESVEGVLVDVQEPFVDTDGHPAFRVVKKTVQEKVAKTKPANIVRITSIHNDAPTHRLFVRFFYGCMEHGKFQPAVLDDGVVFGGPTYIENEFHTDPSTTEEQEMLAKIAEVLKWDGAMRAVTA
jgi:hypothetical protein